MTRQARGAQRRPAPSASASVEGRISDGAWRRLTEHFFGAMFDFGILTQAGADSFKHLLLGAVGGPIAVGFALTQIYAGKYAALSAAGSPEPYRRAVLGDDLFMIGLPMVVAAFVTLLVSRSLFPDERDFRILGPLPVRQAVVFGAKLLALLLFTGAFIAVAHVALVPLMLLTSMNRFGEHAVLSRLGAWAIASVGASLFAVLAITAIVGVLVLALPGSRWHALNTMMRSLLLAALVLCVPLVFHLSAIALGGPEGVLSASNDAVRLATWPPWLALLPPAWFLGIERALLGSREPWFLYLSGIAVAAVSAAAAIVAVAYTLLFRHVERFMLRPSTVAPRWSRTVGTSAFLRATPAFRSVSRFTIATLRRSELHQGVLFGLSAIGAGFAVNRIMGTRPADWWGTVEPSASLTSAALWTPFALMFACGVAVRAAFALPLDHRANWIFRLTEDEASRREQLRAVDRVVTAYVAGVPVAAAFPVLWLAFGPAALIAAAIAGLVGLVFVHAVLLDWRRIPFTCSYLPGKRFIAHSLLFGGAAFALFTLLAAELVRAATGAASRALVIAAALSFSGFLLRRRRLAIWSATPLMFEDELPGPPQQLRL